VNTTWAEHSNFAPSTLETEYSAQMVEVLEGHTNFGCDPRIRTSDNPSKYTFEKDLIVTRTL